MSKMGQELIQSLHEVLDHASGKIELRTSWINKDGKLEYGTSKLNVVKPVCKTISADEIKDTRRRLGMTQSIFAMTIGVSKKTVESWETGRYMPDGAARRLISVMQSDPSFPEKYGIIQK